MPGTAFTQIATSAERQQMKRVLGAELDAGGSGIGFLLDYNDAGRGRGRARYDLCGRRTPRVSVFVHVRRGIDGDPAGLLEVIESAERHGAAVDICHLNASAMSGMDDWLEEIDAARARGVDVTTEKSPWTSGSAPIASDGFHATGERFLGSTIPMCIGPRPGNG